MADLKHKRFYEAHRAARIQQTKEAKRKRQIAVLEYLDAHPCVDCGEKDVRCLEFDHVRGEKEREISLAILYGWSIPRIMAEISKCDVRCANCHKKRTSRDFNWFKADRG